MSTFLEKHYHCIASVRMADRENPKRLQSILVLYLLVHGDKSPVAPDGHRLTDDAQPHAVTDYEQWHEEERRRRVLYRFWYPLFGPADPSSKSPDEWYAMLGGRVMEESYL